MALFGKKSRTFVLGIDGVPYSFLKKKFKNGEMPNLADLCSNHNYKKMNSVYPTISSVAWTSYMTGTNPAKHNIFGFVDRDSNPFGIKIPTARDRKAKTLFKKLSDLGKKVIVMNVPVTYPPEKVNGIQVAGFLCTDINKVSNPSSFNDWLKSRDYVIDVDAWLARTDKKEFMNKLHKALDKRFEIAFELMNKEKWDFFQLHIMETDRLQHFYWNDIENNGEFTNDTNNFFDKLDDFIGKLENKLSKKDSFLILSDHGFCGIKNDIQLNTWLEKEGLLMFENNVEKKLDNYSRESICYSLLPGRIFVNLESREEKGSVKKEDYKDVRNDIKKRLLDFKNPENGEKIIDKVFFREEIYDGEYIEGAADIIAHPNNGYDLKGRVGTENIFDSSPINGMHTYDDAFIFGKNIEISGINSIEDVSNVIMNIY